MNRKYAQSQLVQDIEAGTTPSISRKLEVLLRGKDLQAEMTRYYSNLSGVQE